MPVKLIMPEGGSAPKLSISSIYFDKGASPIERMWALESGVAGGDVSIRTSSPVGKTHAATIQYGHEVSVPFII